MITPHVVSYKLAKQLREVGYPQQAGHHYYWAELNGESFTIYVDIECGENPGDYSHLYAAPIFTELLDVLPQYIYQNDRAYELVIRHNSAVYQHRWSSGSLFRQEHAEIQDALALMVLELNKRKLLTFNK